MIIEATHIHKSFGSLEVLKGIDLTVAPREIISIVGASGAGKTTLLQILGTLEAPAEGASLKICGEEVTRLSARRQAELRNRQIGFIFQAHQLLPEFTALENVMLPALIAGESRSKVRERALGLLERLGLAERASHKPAELSGGESQRVAVARALINSPAVIFADEPSGSLDTANKQSLHQLFFDLRDELGQTFVIVTHDPEFAAQADRMIVLRDGRIEAIHTRTEAPTEEHVG
ncbi:ABC transporter ATP-binding protein [Porphyromonas sp.]|uniref:ABC transporter ATP-binding protein n=1 Tax=Porphyromonas sp. TaxID=1924944 RepID=UPI001CB37C45|nr:ABC transporter ATP-binding protein [Porphyromonas sp.]MBF1382633.1 ABC transporter ATP-binding protein [Porphyromonas sp.]